MRRILLAGMLALALVGLVGGVLVAAAATASPQATFVRLGQVLPVLHWGASGGETDKTLLSTKYLDGKADDDEERGIFCYSKEGKNARHHPSGDNLARRFDVPYTEIMKRFCRWRSFGEIALGYKVAEMAGVTPEEVFVKRDAGLGWGQIKQEYDLKGKLPAGIEAPPGQSNDNQGNKHAKKDKDKDSKNDKGNGNKGKP